MAHGVERPETLESLKMRLKQIQVEKRIIQDKIRQIEKRAPDAPIKYKVIDSCQNAAA
jgi:hypothetical protein